MTRYLALIGALAVTSVATAQQEAIRWRAAPREAVNEAKQTLRPLMVYVLAGTEYRDDKLERDQKRALADPRVAKLAERFIPLKLSRSQHREYLKEFGFAESANMEMSFVTPDGEVLGPPLSAGGVGNADSLAQTLKLVLQEYGKKPYEAHVRPSLEHADAKPDELKKALKLIDDFRVASADQAVTKLLEREKLDPGVKQMALAALAGLSTKPAVDKLLTLSRAGDDAAAKALAKCTPAGAELMLADLQPDAAPFDYVAYKTAAQICRVRNFKPAGFFERGSARLKADELERVRKLVAAEAQRWRQENAEGS